MIDLHTHILPGLDDGAQDMDEALEMAELALEGGVKLLVATPHSNQEGRFENYSGEQLTNAWKNFCQALVREKIPLEVMPGMEIFASEDIGAKLEAGKLFGLNHTKCCLVEFPFDAGPEWIGERLEDVIECGRTPLIAHPERYFCVQDFPALVYSWIQIGCYTQMNKGSLFGKFGRHAKRAADILLANDLVTCAASDAHSPYTRTTYMYDLKEYLTEQAGERQMYRLLHKNPERIISGQQIPAHGRPPEIRRRFFW